MRGSRTVGRGQAEGGVDQAVVEECVGAGVFHEGLEAAARSKKRGRLVEGERIKR